MRPLLRFGKLVCVTALGLVCVTLTGVFAWSFYHYDEWSVVRDRVVQRQTDQRPGFKTQYFSRVVAMRGGLTLGQDDNVWLLEPGEEDQPTSNRWWPMHDGGRVVDLPADYPHYGSMTVYDLEPTFGWSWLGWSVDDWAPTEPGLTEYTVRPRRAISLPLPLLILLTGAIPLIWLRGHLRRRRLARRGFAVEPVATADAAEAPPA